MKHLLLYTVIRIKYLESIVPNDQRPPEGQKAFQSRFVWMSMYMYSYFGGSFLFGLEGHGPCHAFLGPASTTVVGVLGALESSTARRMANESQTQPS